jgi:hypothetical protein
LPGNNTINLFFHHIGVEVCMYKCEYSECVCMHIYIHMYISFGIQD